MFARGLSDHSPIVCSFRFSDRKPFYNQSIPSFVIRSPKFKSLHDDMVSEAKLDKLPTIQRWELHKQIIQDAARIARNDELENFPDKFDSRFLTLTTIGRVASQNNVKLAFKLIARSSLAREHIVIDNERVELLEPDKFEQSFTWQCEKALSRQIAS